MEDLSLHILDVVENSIRAGASQVLVRLDIDSVKDALRLTIVDDGRGIPADDLPHVSSPFYSRGKGKRFGFGRGFFLGREDNHRNVLCSRIGAEELHERQPVDLGHD